MGKLIAAVWIIGGSVLGVAGCATLYQQTVAAIRQPGDQIETTPDDVWRELDCENRTRPFVKAESMEIVPERIRPGARVNYRLIYVMCPARPSEVITTRISRRLLYKGQEVAASVNEAFEIKPGRWIVDSFFTLPANSPLGIYALEVSFESPRGEEHKQARSFVVGSEAYLSGG